MGWPLDHPIGHKFAHVIAPEDVILIARRYESKPEIVGFGVVRGKFKRSIKGVETPTSFGSARTLRPFIPMSGAPHPIRLIEALGHSRALAQLHPDRSDTYYKKTHAMVRHWMEQMLSRNTEKEPPIKADREERATPKDARIAAPPRNYQLDYNVRTESQRIRAIKREAVLLQRYSQWLDKQGRKLPTTKHGRLQCDGFEEGTRNLIEAKGESSRERIRMAVGQLLDYGFQIQKKFGKTHMAILLPKKPRADLVDWLGPLGIRVIWREKGAFLDNANGQFT
jgi:hypothetical protein